MNRILCVTLALLLLSACFLLRMQNAATEGFNFDAAELTDKKLWTQVNDKPYHVSTELDSLCRAPMAQDYKLEAERSGNPHIAASINVFVNNAGKQAMFTKQPHFPEGSIIVKQKLAPFFERNQPVLYTVMRKREVGYNPAVGDWEFLVVSGDGKQVQASGKLDNCQVCHVGKKDSDFVFRSYLKFE
jgi:hypothetical protein